MTRPVKKSIKKSIQKKVPSFPRPQKTLVRVRSLGQKTIRCQSRAQRKGTMDSNVRKARCGNRYAWYISFFRSLLRVGRSRIRRDLIKFVPRCDVKIRSHFSNSYFNCNAYRLPERIFTSSCGCLSPWGLFYSTSGF